MWHYNYSYNELYHYGVLGMKWGHRKKYEPTLQKSKTYTIPQKKSGHRVRLEAKYLKKGYSDSDAQQMAAKQIRGEKFVAGVLAAAAVTGASYIAYREIGKRYSGVLLKAGAEVHNINHLGDKADFNRTVYTSFQKDDLKKYRGLFVEQHLKKKNGATSVYDAVLRATEDIKAPSQKEASKMYSMFLKNNPNLTQWSYNDMNNRIVEGDQTAKSFMSFLKSKGYNAILDANDQFISGYDTKKPLIIFNAASSTVKVGQSIVNEQLSKKLYHQQMIGLYAKSYAPIVAVGAAYIGGTNALITKNKYDTVKSYLEKHPDVKSSYGTLYNALKERRDGTFIIDEQKLKGA